MKIHTVFLLRFIMTLACFLLYLLFFNVKQFQEVTRPKDSLTRLRWIILGVLILATITFVPSLVYLYFLSLGHQYEGIRKIAVFTSGINLIGSTFLLFLIFTYRIKERKEDDSAD